MYPSEDVTGEIEPESSVMLLAGRELKERLAQFLSEP